MYGDLSKRPNSTFVIPITTFNGFVSKEGQLYHFKGVTFWEDGNEWYSERGGKAVMVEAGFDDNWL